MKIEEFLKSLGSTSEEIADNLRKMDVKGEKENDKFCPVIKAIYKQFPNLSKGLIITFLYSPERYINTVYGRLHIESSSSCIVTWDDRQTLDPICPAPIGQFVEDFDNGKYPDLVGDDVKTVAKKAREKLTKEELLALGL